MPVNSNSKYANIETQVYSILKDKLGYSTAVICGILANIQGESNFNPTVPGDNYTSYGLCQWRNERRESLFNRSRTRTPSVEQQIDFMHYELNNSEKNAGNRLKNISDDAQGAYKAADIFCRYFERPKYPDSEGYKRGTWAKDNYYPYYSGNPPTSKRVANIAQDIIKAARSVVGNKYVEGKKVNDDPDGGADSSGLVYYSYNEGGYTNEDGDGLGEATVAGYYSSFKNRPAIEEEEVAPADLLFYMNSSGSSVEYMAIANGQGGRIYGKPGISKITEESGLGKPYAIRRILSDAQTQTMNTSESSASDERDAVNYVNLTSDDPYAPIMKANLAKVKKAGYDYGYLIDVVNGGEFKFYIPDFSEHAGASWNSISIRGRSVSVMAYEKTESRQISISLELYAGVGLYVGKSLEDSVSMLHKDAFFVKSLEYPDYSDPIVRPPAAVHLILGSAINILGVVSGVTVEHMKPLDSQRRSMYIKLSFTVTQIAVNPIDYRNVREGQYAILNTEEPETLAQPGDSSNTPVLTKEPEEKPKVEDKKEEPENPKEPSARFLELKSIIEGNTPESFDFQEGWTRNECEYLFHLWVQKIGTDINHSYDDKLITQEELQELTNSEGILAKKSDEILAYIRANFPEDRV